MAEGNKEPKVIVSRLADDTVTNFPVVCDMPYCENVSIYQITLVKSEYEQTVMFACGDHLAAVGNFLKKNS